jgi:hypothetical protein
VPLLVVTSGYAAVAQGTVIGDRIVLAVNNVPYTQRQLELYLTIKESIRSTLDLNVTVVNERSWSEALNAFTEEMMILQEALRLGSFAAPDQLLDKYNAVLRTKLARNAPLSQTMVRLGVDDLAMSRALDSVLRVASFRQNKNRQESQIAGAQKTAPVAGEAKEPKWLQDLRARANTRVLAGAEVYLEIEPTVGGLGDRSP